ncbi:Hydroxysqualene dehydroxylase [Rhodovastum atsumiense]|uniref:NAD(P)-binding protein n=1 Tax=Rhodovastum atsumiense TaxID=504468 RepID=A0A5M6IJZ5_9PROT|nr:hydroxysqualene dehydroxylase HpnE [Rhodovastum atsumiense]KAA5608169.1 NAD(P)-binding protein [Rhodovastum atsumiense]CAH2600952.1 Hydroxysqualene dehydroxylase [Rhodovastum atsumiense]
MRVHVIGAGLAGLASAVALGARGVPVTLYEAGPAAGGRCRSYFDRGLGCRIDNGNHLLLSGNQAAMAYLDRIGARASLGGPGEALFPFVDLASGTRWTLRPDAGRIPWWILRPDRRVPGTRLREYLQLLALRRAAPEASVTDVLDPASPLYRRLIEPLAVAALNTPPQEALAGLLRQVVEQTLLRGGAACVPLFPREGLSESLVDPALDFLATRGGRLLTGRRIAAIEHGPERVTALHGPDGPVAVEAADAVVMAVPSWVAADLLPGLPAPAAFQAILNIHFRVSAPPGPAGFVGVVGGTAEWIFMKGDVVSVTISAANHLVDLPATDIAEKVWSEVRQVLALEGPMPPVRVVKEKRATFAATAAEERRRPGPCWPKETLGLRNLLLAGDWTATGLPATIEGAIRSGNSAAGMILAGV